MESSEQPQPLTRSARGTAGISLQHSEKSSSATPIPPHSRGSSTNADGDDTEYYDVDLTDGGDGSSGSNADETWNTVENITALGLSFGHNENAEESLPPKARFTLEPDPHTEALSISPGRLSKLDTDLMNVTHQTQDQKPFERWMRTLNRNARQRRGTLSGESSSEHDSVDNIDGQGLSRHKKSSSSSSFGFVTAVKSASISLASFSVAPRSRRTGISSRHTRTDRSTGNVSARRSEDSGITRAAINDEAVAYRSLQRRRVLEEIISTEESYVADVKFLTNVYVTLLASIPTLSLNLRASINRNLTEIVELHDELLGDLHRVVPHSEYTQSDTATVLPAHQSNGHHRWRSLDAVPEDMGDLNLSWLQKVPGMVAEPNVAAEVAKIFGQKMHRFFAYEEYGAKYELMVKDVASTYRTISQWEVYQKGLEALAASVASINSQEGYSKKSLTVGDLLVKPIQRVCRYPLLFAELLKQTPVCDCPDSHIEIEKVLARLRETTTEINRATDDPTTRALLAKTWLLQDRLIFPAESDVRSKNAIRTLGHVHVCGVLHITWQSREGVQGQYMISLLYRDCLVLATAGRADQVYTILATIALCDVRVEEVDNGRGLQCHTASFSWKLVFECDHELYEIIMSACSQREEMEWRTRFAERSLKDHIEVHDQAFFPSLSLRIKSMGTVFGKPGTIARRISIHRATTVGPKSSLFQVIIKNTSAIKETHQLSSSNSSSSININRSQSLLTTNSRIPVLAPSRVERARLESLLCDVWTRDVLPFPGITGRARSEHLVRASASSMMRKLSVASIASSFTRRSGSIHSLPQTPNAFRRQVEEEDIVQIQNQDASRDGEISRNEDQTQTQDQASTIQSPYAGVYENGNQNYDKQNIMIETSLVGQSENSTLSTVGDNASEFDEKKSITRIIKATKSDPPIEPTKKNRLGLLQTKSSWNSDSNKRHKRELELSKTTPPLRTTSANSATRTRLVSGSTEIPRKASKGEENLGCAVDEKFGGGRQGKWLGVGLNGAFSTEGLRGLFR